MGPEGRRALLFPAEGALEVRSGALCRRARRGGRPPGEAKGKRGPEEEERGEEEPLDVDEAAATKSQR